jgi:hypothetical protein
MRFENIFLVVLSVALLGAAQVPGGYYLTTPRDISFLMVGEVAAEERGLHLGEKRMPLPQATPGVGQVDKRIPMPRPEEAGKVEERDSKVSPSPIPNRKKAGH